MTTPPNGMRDRLLARRRRSTLKPVCSVRADFCARCRLETGRSLTLCCEPLSRLPASSRRAPVVWPSPAGPLCGRAPSLRLRRCCSRSLAARPAAVAPGPGRLLRTVTPCRCSLTMLVAFRLPLASCRVSARASFRLSRRVEARQLAGPQAARAPHALACASILMTLERVSPDFRRARSSGPLRKRRRRRRRPDRRRASEPKRARILVWRGRRRVRALPAA